MGKLIEKLVIEMKPGTEPGESYVSMYTEDYRVCLDFFVNEIVVLDERPAAEDRSEEE